MSEDAFALSPLSSASPVAEADYDAIHDAVMETVRGRWFLAEYARRNRNADTKLVLGAIDRIEAAIRGERTTPSFDRIRFDLHEMALAIVRTKAEIAAIGPDGDREGRIGAATAELDSIVQATATATGTVLQAAEQVQELAWTLRERGVDPGACDALDARATDIYLACEFQDLTGQRTQKVMEVLRFLEQRIDAMIAIWATAGDTKLAEAPGQAPEPAMGQADVDVVMAPSPSAATPSGVFPANPAAGEALNAGDELHGGVPPDNAGLESGPQFAGVGSRLDEATGDSAPAPEPGGPAPARAAGDPDERVPPVSWLAALRIAERPAVRVAEEAAPAVDACAKTAAGDRTATPEALVPADSDADRRPPEPATSHALDEIATPPTASTGEFESFPDRPELAAPDASSPAPDELEPAQPEAAENLASPAPAPAMKQDMRAAEAAAPAFGDRLPTADETPHSDAVPDAISQAEAVHGGDPEAAAKIMPPEIEWAAAGAMATASAAPLRMLDLPTATEDLVLPSGAALGAFEAAGPDAPLPSGIEPIALDAIAAKLDALLNAGWTSMQREDEPAPAEADMDPPAESALEFDAPPVSEWAADRGPEPDAVAGPDVAADTLVPPATALSLPAEPAPAAGIEAQPAEIAREAVLVVSIENAETDQAAPSAVPKADTASDADGAPGDEAETALASGSAELRDAPPEATAQVDATAAGVSDTGAGAENESGDRAEPVATAAPEAAHDDARRPPAGEVAPDDAGQPGDQEEDLSALLFEPARPALDQPPLAPTAAAAGAPDAVADALWGPLDVVMPDWTAPAPAPSAGALLSPAEIGRSRTGSVTPLRAEPTPESQRPAAPAASAPPSLPAPAFGSARSAANDPLAPVKAMTDEEKIALFS